MFITVYTQIPWYKIKENERAASGPAIYHLFFYLVLPLLISLLQIEIVHAKSNRQLCTVKGVSE